MLLSLQAHRRATAPLREASLFHDVLTAVGREPILAFLIGAVLAWLFHSTLAVILLIASFLANGSLELAGALAFILGINLGGGLPPVTATLALPPAARRLPLANLLCRGAAAILCSPSSQRIAALGAEPARRAGRDGGSLPHRLQYRCRADLPALHRLVDKTDAAAPARRDAATPTSSRRRAISMPSRWHSPTVALSNALLETVRMTEVLDRMFETALDGAAHRRA